MTLSGGDKSLTGKYGNVLNTIKTFSNIQMANEKDGSDIFDSVNKALERGGENTAVLVEPGSYTKDGDNKPVNTQLQSTDPDQFVFGLGSQFEAADGMSQDLVRVKHDNVIIEKMTLLGNRNNTSLSNCLSTDTGLRSITLRDVNCASAPTGILIDDLESSTLDSSGSVLIKDSVDKAMHVRNCTNVNIGSIKSTDYNQDGILVENSQGINTSNLEIIAVDGSGANAAIHLKGVKNSTFRGLVTNGSDYDIGVLDEAFDVGGDNETVSDANIIDVNVEGAKETGIILRDALKEDVRANIDGDTGEGRTTTAFEVEKPNDIANPQHTISLDASTITRITDTDVDGQQDGMLVTGHFSKVQDSSIVSFGRQSTVELKFGEAVNNPALEVKSNNVVKFQKVSRRTSTAPDGQINIDWSDSYHFGDKPLINISLEQSGEWFVTNWNTDANGRYTDADIQVTDSSGSAVGNGVNVNAKILGT